MAEYYNFDIALTDYAEQNGTEAFKVYVASTSDGHNMPAAEAELQKFDKALRNAARQLGKGDWDLDGDRLDSAGRAWTLGEYLGALLFPPKVRSLFNQCYDTARMQHKVLRVRLQIHYYTLASLPWEFVWLPYNGATKAPDKRGYLARNRNVSLVRQVLADAPVIQPKFWGAVMPVRVLALFANTKDYPHLNLDQERTNLTKLLGNNPNAVKLIVDNATRKRLDAGLRALADQPQTAPAHVLHFSGHGVFNEVVGGGQEDEGHGAIIFMDDDDDGASDELAVDALVERVNGKGIRLVVLNSCQGGQVDGVNPWTGLAPALIRADIPVVVAMQFTVNDQTAIAFSETFYSQLLAGETVEQALTEARIAMSDAGEKLGEDSVMRDWGTPVLYLRGTSDLVLFPQAGEAVAANGGGHEYEEAPPPSPPPKAVPKNGGAKAPRALEREDIRLDVAAPEKVVVGRAFDLAVAIRQPNSPVLTLEDLPKVRSAQGIVFRGADQELVKYRVEVNAPDCEIDKKAVQFLLERGKDSQVQYFQLTPQKAGAISVVVDAFQEDDLLAASTRTKVEAVVEATPPPPAHKAWTPQTLKNINHVSLRDQINQLERAQLESICLRLTNFLQARKINQRVDLETVGGSAKPSIVLNLIQYCDRRGWLGDLIDAVNAELESVGLPPLTL